MNFFRMGQKPITVVSGLPRSGTSMMMQMLQRGGMALLADTRRTADDSNPEGYFEYAPVKRMHTGDTAWLADARGKAVKVVSALLPALPAVYAYRIVFMQRDLAEVVRSQRAMLQRLGTLPEDFDEDEAYADSLRHLQAVEKWLAGQARLSVLFVGYADVLADPAGKAADVAAFVGADLDAERMASAVNPTLYRERGEDEGGEGAAGG